MHPVHHIAVTTALALGIRRHRGSFPWLFWMGSALTDVDHILWRFQQNGDANPLAAWRYFTSEPEDGPDGKLLLHRYSVITALALMGRRQHRLRQFAVGLACHRLLDDGAKLWRRGRRFYVQRHRARLRAIVFAREQHHCQGCGTGSLDLELHHRIPEHLGGPNHPDNLLALCRSCHDRAHGRSEQSS